MSNAIGDGYITQDTGHLWTWDGAGWNDVGRIVGPPGPPAAADVAALIEQEVAKWLPKST